MKFEQITSIWYFYYGLTYYYCPIRKKSFIFLILPLLSTNYWMKINKQMYPKWPNHCIKAESNTFICSLLNIITLIYIYEI
jgi:hypothetical protein